MIVVVVRIVDRRWLGRFLGARLVIHRSVWNVEHGLLMCSGQMCFETVSRCAFLALPGVLVRPTLVGGRYGRSGLRMRPGVSLA